MDTSSRQTPRLGVPCTRARPTHSSTVEFRELCRNGNLSEINQFLSHQREIEQETPEALRPIPGFEPYEGFVTAIQSGRVQVVQHFIGEGFSLEWKEHITVAIEGAASSGQTEMLDLLVGHGWDPRRSEFSRPDDDLSSGRQQRQIVLPQYSSIREALHNERVVRWFIDQGVDGNVETYGGRTAISDACRMAPLSIVKLLVELGSADVTDKDVVAQAVIGHNSGVPRRLEVVEYVLDLGAPINMYADVSNTRPGAYWSSYVAVMGLETALLHATKARKEDMVKLLVERGADKSIKGGLQRSPREKLMTPLEMAEDKGFDNIVKLLR